MRELINKLISVLDRGALKSHRGKLSYQYIFERLYKIGLEGMNYGNSLITDNGEVHCLRYLRKCLCDKRDIVVFDVGANKGDYTALLLDEFDRADLKVYSFEPSKAVFGQLKESVTDQRMVAFNIGMGAEAEVLKLYKAERSSGLSSFYQRNLEHFDITMDAFEEVEVTTIDKFCEEHSIETINFLKIDVEGHECKVLDGAANMLDSGKIEFIQFEFGGCNIDSRTYFQDLYYVLKDRYLLYRIVKDGLYPIQRYQESYEVFSTANFLAKLKIMA